MNQELFNEIVNNMLNAKLQMKSLIVTHNEVKYKHFFEEEKVNNVRSISKTMTSLAFGIAMAKGYFKEGVETYIMPYFADVTITNKENLKYLDKIQIKHLLTLTFGIDTTILHKEHIASLEEGANLVEFALNYPLKYEVGTFFFYNNAPSYLLSVIIEKEVGMKLSEFFRKEVIEKVEITKFKWSESKQGHSMGCTGMELLPSDLHKLGELFLNNGIYNNEQIIPIEWLKEMSKLKVLTPNRFDETRGLPKYGYGYNMWVCKNDIYYHDGSDGQYMIIIPSKNIVITTMGNQKNMKPIIDCMRKVFTNY